MIALDWPIRFLILLLIIGRIIWSSYVEHRPQSRFSTKELSLRFVIEYVVMGALYLLLYVQLLGYDIFPYKGSLSNLFQGCMLIIISTVIMIVAKNEEIKSAHEKQYVNKGIYRYIRHPFLLSLVLTILGVQFIVASYLLLLFVVILPWITYLHIKHKEKQMIKQYGKDYTTYQQHSWHLIPYVW